MAWTPQTSRAHFVYGAGSWSKYYWDGDYNPGAKYVTNVGYDNCLANCTTLCYGRAIENGYPPPVTSFRNASSWHIYVNEDEGWEVIPYTSGMQLYAGDIVEWSDGENHVGTIEEDGINPAQSSSWWRPRDLSLSLSAISDYFQTTSELQYSFYHYTSLAAEIRQGGHGANPSYVLRFNGEPSYYPEVSALPETSYGTIGELESSVDFRITVTVSNIPSAESIAGNLYCDDLTFINESQWVYGSYTIDGVVYRYGTKTVDLRYTREHDYAYSTVKYLTFDDTFSTGSVSLRAPIRITVDARSGMNTGILSALARKKKKMIILKI